VLHQDPDADALLEPEPAWRVIMPAFCVSEAMSRFRTLERDGRDFRTRLEQSRHEATRMDLTAAASLATALETAIREQDLLLATLPKELSSFMKRLFSSAMEQIALDEAIVRRSDGYVAHHQLSRGDAIVLATIMEHASRTVDARPNIGFLTGNTNDFGRSVRDELRNAGITFFANAAAARGWMNAKPR
jgi:hypothetical protein